MLGMLQMHIFPYDLTSVKLAEAPGSATVSRLDDVRPSAQAQGDELNENEDGALPIEPSHVLPTSRILNAQHRVVDQNLLHHCRDEHGMNRHPHHGNHGFPPLLTPSQSTLADEVAQKADALPPTKLCGYVRRPNVFVEDQDDCRRRSGDVRCASHDAGDPDIEPGRVLPHIFVVFDGDADQRVHRAFLENDLVRLRFEIPSSLGPPFVGLDSDAHREP
mmetsp:Transcript_110034/g.310298  ORF Transcript_110034/g.310298 Transcript_110034/m.310298 type:complete len:219 (-) Transcript_110034:518-1174(-)